MSQIKIAVIDDATMIRDLIKKFIRQNFTNAVTFDANNGQTGMALLKRQPVDLILCDWEMPEMNGEELLVWARQQDNLKNTPFIMVTSRGDKEFVIKAIQSGVSDYLVKPFNNKQFQEKVGKALKRHGIKIEMSQKPAMISGNDSLSVLTGGSSPLTSKPKPIKKAPAKNLTKGIALLRTPNGELHCALQQLDLKSMLGVFKVSDYMPSLLDQVSIDMEFRKDDEKKVMRINGFIQMLKSKDENPNSQMIQVKVFFTDEDPDKRLLISEYVGQFG
ncbi:MAG: response regulator [Kangiella sp.]|nr:MAG: response regulator [Kangiella sp.]